MSSIFINYKLCEKTTFNVYFIEFLNKRNIQKNLLSIDNCYYCHIYEYNYNKVYFFLLLLHIIYCNIRPLVTFGVPYNCVF